MGVFFFCLGGVFEYFSWKGFTWMRVGYVLRGDLGLLGDLVFCVLFIGRVGGILGADVGITLFSVLFLDFFVRGVGVSEEFL